MHNKKDRYILLNSSLKPSELFGQKNGSKSVNPGTTLTIKSIETGDESEIRINIEKMSKIDDNGRYSFTGFLSQRLRTRDGFYPEVTEITGCLSDNEGDTCGLLIPKEYWQNMSYLPPERDKDVFAKRKIAHEILLYNRFKHYAAVSNA